MSHEQVFPASLPAPPSRPRTIAFTSGKGGVGKSSLALSTALLLARRGRRVAILDGDLGLASLHVLLGQTPRFDLRHVVAGDKRLRDILLQGPHGLLVVPAGSGVADLANLGEQDRDELLAQLAEIERAVDFILIDTGAGISDTVLTLIAASDEAVVVTVPEPTSLADAYALMKVIVQHAAAYPFHILMNMVRDEAQAQQVYRSLEQILLRFLGYRPGYAGFVVADQWVTRSVVQQVPFAILAPRAPATRCLETLTDTMLGTTEKPPEASGGFWDRVLQRSWRLT
jgi:flagellar biosynthesis protein FlhG